MATPSSSRTFELPDLISHCQFPLTYHRNGDAIAAESDLWYQNGCSNFTEEKHRHLSVLMAGKLSAYIYDDADDEHLRCSCDVMNLIFLYGDLSDGLMNKGNEMVSDIVMNAFWFPHAYRPTHAEGKLQPEQEPDVSQLARDLWLRMQDAGPGFQARFRENLGLFFEGRHAQSMHRDSGVIPDLKAYIDIRRDSSGLKPLMDFLEYTLQIDLPDDVIENPIMRSLKENINDFCTWSNDLYSFNKEQACGDTYNMVIILMKVQGLDLQKAVDYAGDMCYRAVDAFCESKNRLPSWGRQIDEDVARYVRGLENWIIGGLHWSFMSGRYFGTKGLEIKKSRIVELLPPRQIPKNVVEKTCHNSPLESRRQGGLTEALQLRVNAQ